MNDDKQDSTAGHSRRSSQEAQSSAPPPLVKAAVDDATQSSGQSSAQASPGRILRDAREAKNMSVEELTGHTMLSRATVQALEADDFGRLSQPVFVRGYYRKCAKVLEVPEEKVMAAYAARTGVESPKTTPTRPVEAVPLNNNDGNRQVIGMLLLGVAGVAAALLAWSFWPQFSAENDGAEYAGTSASNQKIEEPVTKSLRTPTLANRPSDGLQDAPPGISPQLAANAAANRTGSSGPNSRGNAYAQPPADTARTSTAEPEAPVAPAERGLRMRFIERSWVDVLNRSGKRVLGGIVAADTERSFSADGAPYKVAIGYTPGVEIFVDGEQLDLSSETNSDNTARFTVELEQ